MKKVPIVLKDSEEIKNIIIQINLKKGSASVLSSFSPWENLALIMEGLSVTAQKCIKEGMDPDQVNNTINQYLSKAFGTYKFKKYS